MTTTKQQWAMRVIITVTEDDIRDVLSSAFGAGTTFGVGYWCERVLLEENGEVDVDELMAALLNGKRVLFLEHEPDGPPKPVSALDFMSAIVGVAVQRGWIQTGSRDERLINFDDLDGPSADSIVQLAVFGEEKYG